MDKSILEIQHDARLHFSARESDDEVGYCHFCCRQLYIADTKFCDKACENRKRQLSWKSAHIELPKTRRNRYIWGAERREPDQFANFTAYKPSWEMYSH